MKRNRQRIWAVLVMLALVLASCESSHPEIVIKMESDHSQIISEIGAVNATLTEKLAAIEQKMAAGFADNAAAMAAIKAAVASLEGTTAEKIAAVEAAVKAQTASLETKLALIEAALEAGFADNAAAQGLIKDAIASLEGTTAEKLAAMEAAMKAQTSDLDTRLAAIEAAVKAGFADTAAAQDLIKKAVESLAGTTQEKLAAIETAVKSQTSDIETKLGLIEAAIDAGFADSAKAQDLILDAIGTLDSNTSGKLAEILQAITGRPDYGGSLADIKKAIDILRKMFVLRVELDKSVLTLYIGETATLTATVFPADATDRSVTWKSSDPAVVEVSAVGEVTAKKAGTAIITVTTVVGGNTATCEVTVTLPTLNGHEYVDLGLPSGIMWATKNVGATAPEEYGDYFAWGEVEPKSDYSWSTYLHAKGSFSTLTKYCQVASYAYNGQTDALTTLEAADDAARAQWGGSWRMPTKEEFEELRKNCTSEWTTEGGVKGRKFTAPNGNSIFLPAAGYWNVSSVVTTGTFGNYWSSSLYAGGPRLACFLSFQSSSADAWESGRYNGYSVRPVSGDGIKVTEVKLDKDAFELPCGTGGKLTATVLPADASNKAVVWTSSNPAVAKVSPDGTVTGKELGKATITVTTTDGGKTAECEVTVKSNFNGYDYVDLGLPSGLKWATMNIGAKTSEEAGDYFAWGETTTKTNYTWETYKFRVSGTTYLNVKLNKYTVRDSYSSSGVKDDKTTLETEDDAARQQWRGSWRMPTEKDFNELVENCTSTWTGNGRVFTSKKNGRSIFLPAAGYKDDKDLCNTSEGRYWSSSLYTSPNVLYLLLSSGRGDTSNFSRFYGFTVRPVTN